jgi:hypothetical protein
MGPRTVRPVTDPSGTLVWTVREHRATKIHRQNGSNEKHARTRKEHDELLAESLLADRPRGAQTAARTQPLEGQHLLPST